MLQTFASKFSGSLVVTPTAGNVFPTAHAGSLAQAPLTGNIYQSNAVGGFSSLWAPIYLANLQQWLDAKVGVTKDGANRVSVWADQSTLAHNLVPYGAVGTQAVWSAAGAISGKPVLTFALAASQAMQAIFALAQPNTVYMAVAQVVAGVHTVSDVIYSGTGAGFAANLMESDASAGSKWAMYSGTALNVDTQFALGAYIYATAVWDGATSKSRVNGVQVAAGTTGNTTGAASGIYVGGLGNNTRFTTLEVGQIVVVAHASSDDEAKIVETYMAAA